MKKYVSLGIAALTLVVLAALIVLPVSGVVASASDVTTAAPTAVGVTPVKPYISATVSSTNPTVGDPVTISGVATGGNFTSGIQIWVFAGNYVNVTNVPVNSDGTFSKTYQSTGLPPGTYYVFVQNPGPDGAFNIDLYDAGVFSGQVFNTKTNTMIFNFTGVGSVQDAAAALALSDALNQPGQDDIYTKLTFQLMAPVATTPAAAPATTAVSTASPTTKSPLPVGITAGALLIGGCCAVFAMRKTH